MINSKRGLILFILISFSFLVLILIIKPEITGYVIYEGGNYIWDFSDINNYSYNSVVIENGVRLGNYTINETSYVLNSSVLNVISAIRDGHENVDKVNALDGEISNVDKEYLFDVSFNDLLYDGDVIRVYIFGESDDDLWLCDKSIFCEKPGYGMVHYIRNESQGIWYNITIDGLTNPADGFNFDPKELKFDYIEAMHYFNNSYSMEHSYYNETGYVETNNVEIQNTYTGRFSADSVLNGQGIEYFYAVNNGSWIVIGSGESINLSAFTNIKFRVVLSSDGNSTPILNRINIDYLGESNETSNQTEENETQINQTINSSQESSISSGGGGGGGSGSSEERLSLERKEEMPIILESSERRGKNEPEITYVEEAGEVLPTGWIVYANLLGNTNYNALLLLVLSLLLAYLYRREIKNKLWKLGKQ